MSGKGSGYKALDWAWKQRDISSSAKLVLVNLAGRSDQLYSCYPRMSLIAEETCLSRRSIARALNELEAADLMMRATRKRANGSTRSNRYYLSHPDAPHVTGILDEDDDDERGEELAQASRRAVERQAERE